MALSSSAMMGYTAEYFLGYLPILQTTQKNAANRVLIATIRDKGICPCPRCLLTKSYFWHIGLIADMSARVLRVQQYLGDKITIACDAIYNLGLPIKGAAVECLLKEFSLVPTFNAFADRLGFLGFNFFPMLIVDLLHEFKLGVFKSIFKHLIRLLYAINPETITVLNECFRSILSFGRGAIQHFPSSVSDVRHSAAWHFEDILQCTIPAFKGLFPAQHDNVVCLLLFQLAEWHALAKLQLHTDDSLARLDQALEGLGKQLRKFQQFTCLAFQTVELPHEVAAHQRRHEANLKSTNGGTRSLGAHPRTFNLSTYKLHALGDYVGSIRLFGTTDSYMTQIGELSHCLIKMLYQNTNKQDVSKQLAKQERRCTRIHRQRQSTAPLQDIHTSDLLIEAHHFMSNTSNFLNLAHYLSEHEGDPAIKVSQAKCLQINYTIYDVHRDQDTLKPGYGGVVMTLSREHDGDTHPFWYAQVLGAFTIQVLHVGPDVHNHSPQSMEFLWVRWFGVVPCYHWSIREGHLPKVGFIPDSPSAFGFLDPSVVLRACHLIPALLMAAWMLFFGMAQLLCDHSENRIPPPPPPPPHLLVPLIPSCHPPPPPSSSSSSSSPSSPSHPPPPPLVTLIPLLSPSPSSPSRPPHPPLIPLSSPSPSSLLLFFFLLPLLTFSSPSSPSHPPLVTLPLLC
ncbi:uncharacterized protein BJ212DRAFT_1485167 [Suillus subaureus]|uniref:Uncharacterized protein n=1 Tax=Suillus subaureus TaxID=48587 RepID=A0A9P7E0T3_9AGAM|nr:uncharacterized protein BJ212DRAFT_1485167 [Suillus subaureus]KAG1808227.1 hypothetical protein BJ212DRAFT_1485167 [Suillus subaureus]